MRKRIDKLGLAIKFLYKLGEEVVHFVYKRSGKKIQAVFFSLKILNKKATAKFKRAI